MTRFKKLFGLFLPVLMLMSLLTGNVQAALLDFGPIVPEVDGSTSPNIGHGFPAWFRDTNRVPLQMCLDEVGGCLFAAADRPNPAAPASFPANLPDELFYYSATATMTTSGGDALLFAGVEMNFFNNGPGDYDQVGFSRVRIRFDTTITGNYTVTTPWKQYHFTVTAADLVATPDGRRIVNATEDIGLRADGDFAGVITGNIGPYGYSQGAPFVTATGAYLGDGTPRILQGTPNNIFRIEGPPGFTTVSTNLFAITGKLYTDPIATPLTVDKLTYVRDAAGVQVNAFATTDPLANPRNTTALFPLNFSLSGVPSALQLSGTGLPTQGLTTNNPADGKFFSTSGVFAFQGNLPTEATVTNIADAPDTPITVPLVDQVVVSNADYDPLTSTLSIAAVSYDSVDNPALQAFIAGTDVLLGTLVNGQLNVTFPVTIGPVTYNIPPLNVTVKSAKLGSATLPVSVFVHGPLVLNTTSLANGAVNAAYNQSVTATGGTSPFTWTATGLPSGLFIDPTTGIIFGIPANVVPFGVTFTTFPVSVTVTDGAATTVNTTLNLRINQSAPAAPSGLSAVATSGTRVDLTWTDNANNESGFDVQRATDAGFTTGLKVVYASGVNRTTFADTTVVAGTTYFYRLRGQNFVAYSPTFSNTVTVTPTVPALVISTTSLANGAVNVGYIQATAAAGGTAPYTWSATGLPTGLTINPSTGVISGTPANVVPFGVTFTSFPVTLTVTDSTTATATAVLNLRINQSAPAAPSGLSAVATSSTRVDLAWTDNANNESGFDVQRATDAGFTTGLRVVYAAGVNRTTFADTTVVAGTAYFYRLRGQNYVAYSPTFSNTVTVTTP